MKKIDDRCAAPARLTPSTTQPSVSPIYPAAVYVCESADQANSLLGGATDGYVYQRDGHPNADQFAEVCRGLHGAESATVTSSGMAAISLALLALVKPGDHLVIGNQLYGRTRLLLTQEAVRLGIGVTEVDTCDLDATAAAMTDKTRMLIVETITNPLLRVSDIESLATLAHDSNALLMVDNTFATPAICQPMRWGADLVMESVSKLMNGHGDLMLGLLCGKEGLWDRVPMVQAAWGFASSPMDCWLAQRGLSTLHLRADRASENALSAAKFLARHQRVKRVDYPGLADHHDHELAKRLFSEEEAETVRESDRGDSGQRSQESSGSTNTVSATTNFGSMVSFQMRGDWDTANQLIASIGQEIPFCPSLGEIPTTLSHPASTSHRGLTPDQRSELGITDATIRLSLGIQSAQFIVSALEKALGGLD